MHDFSLITSIPPPSRKKFLQVLQNAYSTDYKRCPDAASHKYILTDPQFLIKNEIPFVCVLQEAKDLIVTYPGAFHQGFNTGFNVAEAVNIATPRWLSAAASFLAREKCTCPSLEPVVHIDPIPHLERLLIGNC